MFGVLLAAVSPALLIGVAVAGTGVASPPDSTTVEEPTATNSDSTEAAGTAADSSTPDSTAVGPELDILPPDEPFGGATLGEWHARWWQWAASLPAEFECNYGQHGPMFFLPPAFQSSFDCVVPEGTAIYALADGNLCSSVLPPPNFGSNEEELQTCVDALPPTSPSLEATANGQPVVELDTYRTTSPMFTLNMPEHSVYDGLPRAWRRGWLCTPPTSLRRRLQATT